MPENQPHHRANDSIYLLGVCVSDVLSVPRSHLFLRIDFSNGQLGELLRTFGAYDKVRRGKGIASWLVFQSIVCHIVVRRKGEITPKQISTTLASTQHAITLT